MCPKVLEESFSLLFCSFLRCNENSTLLRFCKDPQRPWFEFDWYPVIYYSLSMSDMYKGLMKRKALGKGFGLIG
jgi:hypothetical protein